MGRIAGEPSLRLVFLLLDGEDENDSKEVLLCVSYLPTTIRDTLVQNGTSQCFEPLDLGLLPRRSVVSVVYGMASSALRSFLFSIS